MELKGNLTTECVKEINQIGHTAYQNICNGSINNVPWGNSTWAISIVAILVILGMVGIFVYILWTIR